MNDLAECNETNGTRRSCSYQELIAKLCQQDPSLQNLSDFLAGSPPCQYICRITCLEFQSTKNIAQVHNLDINGLDEYLRLTKKCSGLLGQLLVVEDLTRDAISILGSSLQIDPLFFAIHLFASRTEISTTKGYAYTLSSTARLQGYLNIRYARPIVFEGSSRPAASELSCSSNVRRKVGITRGVRPMTSDEFVGNVARHFSLLMIARENGLWLCLILVDPPVGNIFPTDNKGGGKLLPYISKAKLFQGGFVDFACSIQFNCATVKAVSGPKRLSMLDDLIYYWTNELPPGFDAANPNLLSLAYYPIKIAGAEWYTLMNAIDLNLESYESSLEGGWRSDLERLESNLRYLYSWQRRCATFAAQVQLTKDFIEQNNTSNSNIWTGIAQDYHYLANRIDHSRKLFKIMIPVVTSKIQIMEARRSFEETTSLSRLTYLALVFVPLTFVSSLFSMSGDVAPGQRSFWVYFAIAIPFLAATFAVVTYKHLYPWKKSVKHHYQLSELSELN